MPRRRNLKEGAVYWYEELHGDLTWEMDVHLGDRAGGTSWEYVLADPRGLAEEIGYELETEPHNLLDITNLLRRGVPLPPVVYDPIRGWYEGTHRLVASIDLELDAIPALIRVT